QHEGHAGIDQAEQLRGEVVGEVEGRVIAHDDDVEPDERNRALLVERAGRIGAPGVHPPDAGDGPRLLGEQVFDAAVVLPVAPLLALEHEREGGVLVDQDAREGIHHVEDAEGRRRHRLGCYARSPDAARRAGIGTRDAPRERGKTRHLPSSLLSTGEHPQVGHPAKQTTPRRHGIRNPSSRYVVRWGLRRREARDPFARRRSRCAFAIDGDWRRWSEAAAPAFLLAVGPSALTHDSYPAIIAETRWPAPCSCCSLSRAPGAAVAPARAARSPRAAARASRTRPGRHTSPRTPCMSLSAAAIPSAACEPHGSFRSSAARSPRPPTAASGSFISVFRTTMSI